MKRILITILLLIILQALPGYDMPPVEESRPVGYGFLTEVNYLCSYICRQRGCDPDYIQEACFGRK